MSKVWSLTLYSITSIVKSTALSSLAIYGKLDLDPERLATRLSSVHSPVHSPVHGPESRFCSIPLAREMLRKGSALALITSYGWR